MGRTNRKGLGCKVGGVRGQSTLKDNGSRSYNAKGKAKMTRVNMKRTSPRISTSLHKFTLGIFMDDEHKIKEEREMLQLFLNEMNKMNSQMNNISATDQIPRNIHIEIGKKCIFVKPILRYNNIAQRSLHQRIMKNFKTLEDEDNPTFTGEESTTISSMVRTIRWIFAHQVRERNEAQHQNNPLPIVFITGGEVKRTVGKPVIGHCSTVVISKGINGVIKAYTKDARSLTRLTVSSKTIQLCSQLGVNTIQIIPELENETAPTCLLESIRFCAQIFDGSVSLPTLPQLSYNVSAKKFFNAQIQKDINGVGCLDVKLFGSHQRSMCQKVQKFVQNFGKKLDKVKLKAAIRKIVTMY